MVKCPNCGSTAQIKLTYTRWIENGWEVERVCTYVCGCGNLITTSTMFVSDGTEIVLKGSE